MKNLLLASMMMLVACGAAPVAKPAPPISTGPMPIRCNGGRELDFVRKLQNGDWTNVSIRCTDEHVTASVTTYMSNASNDAPDAPPTVREESGPVEIDHALFDRIWRGAFARADERGCRRQRARDATTALTLRDTHDKREVTCFDLDVTDVVEPLRAVVKVAPPPTPPAANPDAWPFGGEYWRDELGYYRAR